jgi:predicted PurR-regulated permease PerM
LVVAVFNIRSILNLLSQLLTVLSPIIWGIVIAFLMNPIMVRIEKFSTKRIFKSDKNKKSMRAISVTLSSIIFLGIVIGLISVVVPELINSIIEIFSNASTIAANVQGWINKIFRNYPEIESAATEMLSNFNTNLDTVIAKIQPMLENILSGAWGVVTVVKNFLLGFIVSVYMLCGKEHLLAVLKKMIIAVSKKSTCEKVMSVASQANEIFAGFLTGKLIDSVIIGMLCFIGMTIMNMPYNIMISVLIGVTNVIPFFGPFIGAIPSTILILLIEPRKAIPFLIFILVLQQFDGNILGPKILGNTTGLPGFWVLISLLVFGGLFGFVGMVLAVPIFALFYSFTKEYVNGKLKKRSLPTDTDYYTRDIAHLYKKPDRKRPLTAEELESMVIPSADEVNEVNDSPLSVNENDD